MTRGKETDYEIDEGNVFTAIGRKDADELVARSELLDDVGNLIEKSLTIQPVDQSHVANDLKPYRERR